MNLRRVVTASWIALLAAGSFGCARAGEICPDVGSSQGDDAGVDDTGGQIDTGTARDTGHAIDTGHLVDTGTVTPDTGNVTPDTGVSVCSTGASRSCYDGAAGTQGIGVCTPGTEACVAGNWSTLCVGEHTPAAAEICGNGLDDNCNGQVDEGCAVCTAGATRSCYDGPAGTQGVGICAAGTNSCVSGNWSTTCAGETTPAAAENCGNGLDDNCNGQVDEGCVSSDPCSASTDCLTCTGGATCGWCGSIGSCLTGTGSGPNNGACGSADWSWYSFDCP